MSSEIDYRTAPYAVRDDILEAHRRAWRRLAEPGTWLTGEQRVAIAAEARNALECDLCRKRRQSLSPYAVVGEHDRLGSLTPAMIEAVHRIRSDPGRLTKSWYDGVWAAGLEDGEYVEMVGVMLTLVSVDVFARVLGLAVPDLPAPVAGAPSRYRPASAAVQGAWVPTIAPDEVAEAETDLYAGTNGANIYRALSLVPDEARGFRDLDDHLYLPCEAIFDFDTEYRAISHAQIELVAGRVSALNQCVY